MNSLLSLARLAFALFALLLSSEAMAHFPTLSCEIKPEKKDHLFCQAGYSDASLAGQVILKVYSYDDALLTEVTTASDGSVWIAIPKGEYYIVFDAGHESPAEFDYAELG